MSMRNSVALFTSVCFLLLCSLTVMAQSQTTGRIAGTVTDEKGGALPGAEVTVTNKATGEVRTVVADDSGHYIVPLLPSGDYSVAVTANGFKKFVSDDVKVAITETTSLDPSMAVGAVSEVVTVDAAPNLVQTEGAQLGRVVDSRTVAELPLATRNFTQILGLSPGAATYLPDNTSVGRNSQNISVNGARVTNNNFQINGIDANSMGTNSAPSLAVPAPETIQEFKVQTSLYDATFGRSGGGNIQAVTKSGGNDFHGGAYGFLRNARWNANNPFLKAAGVARPVLTRKVLRRLPRWSDQAGQAFLLWFLPGHSRTKRRFDHQQSFFKRACRSTPHQRPLGGHVAGDLWLPNQSGGAEFIECQTCRWDVSHPDTHRCQRHLHRLNAFCV